MCRDTLVQNLIFFCFICWHERREVTANLLSIKITQFDETFRQLGFQWPKNIRTEPRNVLYTIRPKQFLFLRRTVFVTLAISVISSAVECSGYIAGPTYYVGSVWTWFDVSYGRYAATVNICRDYLLVEDLCVVVNCRK